ncbi:MAG: putative Histidinol-phosphate aminotransferase [Promethearchaeota archaeon]|nr:MAG: putative Histidinol-phosphate aminotransferase [Candidatus Lokiarchaeota archaeon]
MKIRLDKNEMPNAPSEIIIDAVKASINHIHRYTPQEKVNELLGLLSNYTNIPEDYLYLNFGSDILIKEFILLFSKNREIIFPDPCFFLIENTALKTKSEILKVKLKPPNFSFPSLIIEERIKKPTLIIVDNPNNPTGKLIIEEKGVKTLLENDQVIMLIDEAYFEFSGHSFLELIKNYPNLGICRTFSKTFGLAASGIGYLIMGRKIQEKFEGLDIMLPYPSVIAAIEALKHRYYMEEYVKMIKNEKERVSDELKKLGFTVYSSATNFLLVKTDRPDLVTELLKHNIFVKDVSNYFPRNHIRITISSKSENSQFLDALKQIKVNYN